MSGRNPDPKASRPFDDFDDAVITYGQSSRAEARPELVSSPLLAALRKAGTSHVYADTADTEELADLLSAGDKAIIAEIDGNTANQPLVRKVIERYLDRGEPATWAQALRARRPDLSADQLLPLLYAIVCGQVGNDIVQAFASGRSWEVSLQLHMGLARDPAATKQIGRYLRRMVPTAFVKVPFAPHAPECFLVARDLEQEGITVNFTSTFSARQAVAAGLLANVARTNIFMGRLNQGLRAEMLGEHVDLEAQRALTRLRRDTGIKTQLIVASMRDWQSFVRTAGCDVYTAPCGAIHDFLTQTDISPHDLQSQIETSYEDRLGIADDVVRALGRDRITRLYRVEPEFVEFLREFSATREYQSLQDGDRLFRRLDEAGFGDLFFAPSETEWNEIRRGKVPDLDAPITKRLPLDTLYSLMADADFEKYQEEMDREIARRL